MRASGAREPVLDEEFVQDLDALHRIRRDKIDACRSGAAESTVDNLKDRVAVAALAIDHQQGVIGVETSQTGTERKARHVRALRLGGEGRDHLGQRLVEVRLTDLLQRGFAQKLDWRSALGGLCS